MIKLAFCFAQRWLTASMRCYLRKDHKLRASTAATEKRKRVITDMLINLIGTGLPLVALQLVVYPIVARTIDAEAYGR